MINMKQKQEIVLKYFREGQSIRSISRSTGLHRTTVTKYVREYHECARALDSSSSSCEGALIDALVEPPRYTPRIRVRRKVTDAMIFRIKELLALNAEHRHKGRHKQQLKMIDIHEDLLSRGHTISYTSVCSIIKELQEKHAEAFIRQEYALGEECEFDWGTIKLIINGISGTYQCAVFTTCAGNYRYGRLFTHQDTASFQSAHAHFFQKVGGVYKKMIYDNMRVAVKRFVGRTEKEATKGLLQLSLYYLFSFRFCTVRRAHEKGHVERSVEYIRRKIFSQRIEFSSIEEANEYMEKECDRLNEKTPYGSAASAASILEEERGFLHPLKPFFEVGQVTQLKVDTYSTICYRSCHYSVPDTYVGKCVTVRIYPAELKISYNDVPLCTHKRCKGRNEWSLQIEHYIRTFQRKPGALSGSVALAQAPALYHEIYHTYYMSEPKGFIELLDYMKKNDIALSTIYALLQQLAPVRKGDIITDKIKRIYEREREENTYTAAISGTDEIRESSHTQLRAITQVFKTITCAKESKKTPWETVK